MSDLLSKCDYSGLLDAKDMMIVNTEEEDEEQLLNEMLSVPDLATEQPKRLDQRRRASYLKISLASDSDPSVILSEARHLLSEPKNALGLTDPDLTFSVKGLLPKKNEFRVDLRVSRVALFVYLECEVDADSGVFSDNGFILEDSSKSVILTTKKNQTPREIEKGLRVRSYFNKV